MRKILLFLLLIQGVACTTKVTGPAVISGTWERGGTKEVMLYQIVSGRLDLLSTYVLQEDRSFGFAFNVQEEGFYVLGAGNIQAKPDKYTFYFKPGDALSVAVNDTSYTLIGKNTEENTALASWEQYIQPLEFKSVYFFKIWSNYKDFFPQLEEYLQKPFLTKATKNPVFDPLFKRYQTVDFISIALLFLSTPRQFHPQIEEYPDFYRNINIAELTQDTYLLNYFDGSYLLSRMLQRRSIINGINFRDLSMGEVLSEIKNDTLKGEYLLGEMAHLKSYIGYLNLMEEYGQYVVLPDQEKRAEEIKTKLAVDEIKAGQPAVDFSGKDINGKKVSLSDFKGKVVFVDAWATWCGPCIQEMPYLNKLIDDYKGKDIVFMGISLDAPKDKPKWEKFLEEKGSHGVQIFAGNAWESEVAKIYQIKTIPRFLLFDKNGNIVSTDAPRPSTPELRALIDKKLQENVVK